MSGTINESAILDYFNKLHEKHVGRYQLITENYSQLAKENIKNRTASNEQVDQKLSNILKTSLDDYQTKIKNLETSNAKLSEERNREMDISAKMSKENEKMVNTYVITECFGSGTNQKNRVFKGRGRQRKDIEKPN